MNSAELKEFLTVNPSTLAREQRDALTKAVAARLKHLADLLERKCYSEVKSHLSFSPAGDCMGHDNYHINFSDFLNRTEGDADLGDIVEKLEELNKGAD